MRISQNTPASVRLRKILATVCIVLFIVQPALAIAKDPWGDVKTAPTPTVHQKSNKEVMKEYGQSILANAPAEVRSGSNLQKAKYAFSQYCNQLAAANTPVNANLAGRLLQGATSLEPGRWTCSDHAMNLEGLFLGMGITDNDMVFVEANSDSWVPSVNSNHGALAVRDSDGKPYMFDAWGMAVENLNTQQADEGRTIVTNGGSFLYSGAETSTWNGMDIDYWGNTMTSAGYSKFSADGGMSWNQSSSDATETWFDSLPPTYPESFTFVLFPKGGAGGPVGLLYNYPIKVDEKGVVSASFHSNGPTQYIRQNGPEAVTLADLSVSGNYDKNTGKISGKFTSHVIEGGENLEYDQWAKGTFTGQMVRDGKTMTTFMEGDVYYYSTYKPTGVRSGPNSGNGHFPWTCAAVVKRT